MEHSKDTKSIFGIQYKLKNHLFILFFSIMGIVAYNHYNNEIIRENLKQEMIKDFNIQKDSLYSIISENQKNISSLEEDVLEYKNKYINAYDNSLKEQKFGKNKSYWYISVYVTGGVRAYEEFELDVPYFDLQTIDDLMRKGLEIKKDKFMQFTEIRQLTEQAYIKRKNK